MRSPSKKRGIGRAGLAVAAGLALAAGLGAMRWPIPNAAILAPLQQALSRSTGHTVESLEQASASAFPWPTIHLAGLTLSRPGRPAERIEAGLVKARLSAASWLFGEPRLVELALFDPKIALAAPEGEAQSGPPSGQGEAALSAAIVDLLGRDRRRDLRSLRIERGTLRLGDQPWMSDLRLSLSTAAGADLRLVASGRQGGMPLTIEAEVAPVRAQERRPLRWRIAGPAFTGSFDGELYGPRSLDADGQLSIAIVDGSAFARRLNLAEAHAPLLDGLAASGRARFAWPTVQIRRATIERGPTRLEGSIDMAFDGPQPAIAATLDAERFDLTPLLRPLVGALADREGGWSAAPFATGWLHGASLDLRLSAGRLIAGSASIEAAALSLQLGGGRLDATLSDGRLRSGAVKGRLALLGRPDGSVEVRAQGSAEQFDTAALSEAIGLGRMRGLGTGQATLRGVGATLADLVADARGRMEATIRDGEIGGLDLERPGPRAQTATAALAPERRTRFTALTLQMQVEHGKAEFADSAMLAPLQRTSIDGSIGFAERRFDLLLRPTSVAPAPLSAPGAGVTRISLEGPWSNPSLKLDGVERPDRG